MLATAFAHSIEHWVGRDLVNEKTVYDVLAWVELNLFVVFMVNRSRLTMSR